jgi:hypothetical protein
MAVAMANLDRLPDMPENHVVHKRHQSIFDRCHGPNRRARLESPSCYKYVRCI